MKKKVLTKKSMIEMVESFKQWPVLLAAGLAIAVLGVVYVGGQVSRSPLPTPTGLPIPPSPSPSASVRPTPGAKDGCFIGGCNGEVCSDQKGVISICVYKEEYACLKQAVCERQANGKCGWTETDGYKACVKNLPEGGSGVTVY